METRNFTNIDSTAVSDIAINGNDVSVTFKSSGKTYSYTTSDANFVNSLEDVIESNKSVGRFINRAIKEDQTLQIATV
jgi:hypothetical protein